MLTRRIPVSISRVGISIVSALLVMAASLTLLVWNTEAKSVSGGPGCGESLVTLLDKADNGDKIQILTGQPTWDTDGALITKNVLIEGGWSLVTGTCTSTDTTGFQFLWPTQRSYMFHAGAPVVQIDPSVISLTMRYLDIVSGGGAGLQASGIEGVISNNAKILLDNIVVTDGNAVRGGIYLEVRDGSRLVMSNMQITNNTGGEGGGFEIHVYDNSQVIIQGSQIATNSASSGNGGGGLIVIHRGTVTLAGNTFFNNSGSGSGDDLWIEAAGGGPAYLVLRNNLFSGSTTPTDAKLHIGPNVTVLNKSIFLPIIRKNS